MLWYAAHTMKMSLAVALLLVVAAPAVADEPRCEPLAVGTEATLEEAAMSIATCPVEYVLVLDNGIVTHRSVGTATGVRFPRPESRKSDAVHNHPDGDRGDNLTDRCAAMLVRDLYLVDASGDTRKISSLRNSMSCMKLRAKARR